jgi:type II secretory pathway component PulF
MPKYSYQAINESGATVTDVVEADSIDTVNNIILGRGFIPTKVSPAGGGVSGAGFSKLKTWLQPVRMPELILFTKQFKTMLRAGVSMIKLLDVLENQAENPTLKQVIRTMSRNIQEGNSLHEAFSRHPGVFSPLYCGMVRAGEASGSLPEVLDRLTYIIEHENKIRSDIKAALQYPMIVIVLLTAAFFILLTFVIPRFVDIFLRTGVAIPIPTKICILLYQLLIQYWYFPLGIVVGLTVGLSYYFRTTQGKFVRDSLLMRIPVLGSMFIKASMSRFASIFSILQSSGVSARDAMHILAGTIGNTAIAYEFDKINERLEEGRGISEPLRSAKYFTPIVVNMIAIGEESGNLDEMLKEVSDHYDVEMEYAMKKLSDAIGPLLTVGLAFVVGFFALAVFLPMWDLTKMVR